MKKLLQVDSCLATGSTGRITESIAQLAQSQGWECYIVHGARYVKRPSCMHDIQSVTITGEYLHYIEGLFFDNHGLSSRKATQKVIEQIKQIGPDVIHLHCVHGYYLNYKLLFEYLNTINIPVIWTFHDCWAFTGHCSHFVTVGCEKWKTGCYDCQLIGDYPKSLVDKSEHNYKIKKDLFLSNKNFHIVAVSEWLASLTKESFFKGADIRVISNGVDIKTFSPIKNANEIKNNKVFTIIGVATAWGEDKGLSDYIRLSELLHDDEELFLIGIGDKLKKSLPPKIKCIPRTNSVEELASWYNRADVVLSLSKAETFGLTIAEGMACGTPAIVYNNTAQPELVTDDTGYVIENGDVVALYSKIQEIKKMGKTYFSEACRNRVEARYDKNKCFMKYIELYEDLIV